MSGENRYQPPIGIQGNLWSAASTGAATNSNVVDTYSSPFMSIFGHVSGATTLTVMISQDNSTFYAGPQIILGSAGDFIFDVTIGARYIALQSSNSVTATATCSAKG